MEKVCESDNFEDGDHVDNEISMSNRFSHASSATVIPRQRQQSSSLPYSLNSERLRNQSYHDLKGPWVPAPGKTSRSQTDILFTRKQRVIPAVKPMESRSELKISDITTPQTSCSSISEAGFQQDTVYGRQNYNRQFQLKPSASDELSRHRLQTKDSFVDVTTCLTKKRNRLLKLWEEAVHTGNHELLEHLELANSYGEESAALLERLKGFTNDLNSGRNRDVQMLDPLREKVLSSLKNFEDENKIIQQLSQRNNQIRDEQDFGSNDSGAGDRSDNLNLTQLNQLYSENFEIANSVSAKPDVKRNVRASDCKKLEDKICEQEENVKALESELKRVESQHTFDLKLLKSSLDDKLDDFSAFPDVFHLTEMKLAQCMSKLAVMEKHVQDKDAENAKITQEVRAIVIQLNVYKSKVETLSERLRMADCDNSQLKGRLVELETLSFAMKKSSNTDSLLKAIESKLELLKGDNTSAKTEELEEKLRHAKKQVQYYKKAKDDVTARLTKRVDELLEALDESRQKNHTLRNQLRFIRSSYHQLFPSQNIFTASPELEGD